MSEDKKNAAKKSAAPAAPQTKPETKPETVPGVKGPPVPVVGVEDKPKVKKERAPGASVAKAGTIYIFVKDREEGAKKFPLQCEQIFGMIKEAGKDGIKRDALLEKMKTVVSTRQPIERILGYYQPKLVASGSVIMKDEPKAEAKKEEPKTEVKKEEPKTAETK